MHNEEVNKRNLAIVAALMLVGTILISTTTLGSAFGRDANQAADVSISCLNHVPSSTSDDNAIVVGNCSNMVSQQGKLGKGSTQITDQTTNPTINVQPSMATQPPTAQPPACHACFANLTSDQQEQFLRDIKADFPTIDTTRGFSNAVTQLCQILQADPGGPGLVDLLSTLTSIIGISEREALNIATCVDRAI